MIINAGKASFLGKIEDFEDLPSGYRLNKVKTGCGGTSVALEHPRKYVIAMPYTEVIKSKMHWCEQKKIPAVPVFFESGATDEDIYAANKIMVTYDSLPRVVIALGDRVKEFKILVDEYHLLTKSGDFRYKAVNRLLGLYMEFGEYVFMTATPVELKYLPDAIKDIPEAIVHWEDIVQVTLNYTILGGDDLYPAVAGIAYRHSTGERPGNCYFFLNSVRSIIMIIQYLLNAGIGKEDIRIICSDTDDNNYYLEKGLGRNFRIETVIDPPKKINFITSKAFEGVDFLDKQGVTYIISDGVKGHTKYDILTTVPQIIGRIRDTRYDNQAHVIFSPSEYFSRTSEAEYSKFILGKLSEAQEYVRRYEGESNPMIRQSLYKMAISNRYLVINDEGGIEVNDTARKAEMSNFAAMHTTYYIRRTKDGVIIQREGSRIHDINGIPYKFNSIPGSAIVLSRLDAFALGAAKMNFIEMCDIYHSHRISRFGITTEEDDRKVKLIEKLNPLIPEAFKTLGYDKIRSLRYNQKNIKAEILKSSRYAKFYQIRELLDTRVYATGRFITRQKIKADLQIVYDRLDLDRTAKATDLGKIFKVRGSKLKENGSRVNGYVIIAPL
jgi:hypothetical protein